MIADNDIVDIVDGKFSGRSFIHLPSGDWADLRAEIVRLRGEVADRADDLTTAYMAGRYDGKTIAPAEAKGYREFVDVLGVNGEPSGYWIDKRSAPQPADGGAVAADATFAEWLAAEMPAGTVIGNPAWWANRIARQYRVRTTPPAPVQAAPQEGECHMRGRCECIGACKYGLGGNGAMECPACRLEAALQHRGDSQEVGRG